MKIAIVSPMLIPVPPIKYGGIQLIVAEVAKGLAKRGHQVTVFCSGESTIGGENITKVESYPYPTSLHPEENRHWEERQLTEIIKRQGEFDVIHMHYEPAVCRFKIDGNDVDLSQLFTVPVVFTFHNSTSISEHIKYYHKNIGLFKNHNFVFISKNQRLPLFFLPNANIIYNGLAVENFSFLQHKEAYLLFLGRITPSKGILEAITVAEKTKIPLIIAANIDSVDQDFYVKLVKPRIDGELIKYIGEVDFDAKVEYLKKACCLLFPILWEEPFGLVMIEALACGTPVVAFKRGSVPEIIQDGVNGFIVNNVDEMIEAVKKTEMISAETCRQSVEEKFSIKHMINEYENLLIRITKK